MKKILIAVVLLLLFSPVLFHFGTLRTVNGVITDKERVTVNNNSRYLVWVDGGVYESTDSWLALKFNSADVYGSLIIGANCQLRVTGLRIPFLSQQPNILEATCQ